MRLFSLNLKITLNFAAYKRLFDYLEWSFNYKYEIFRFIAVHFESLQYA